MYITITTKEIALQITFTFVILKYYQKFVNVIQM